MTEGDASGTTAESIRTTIRSVLADHPVSFATLFGSSARGTMDDRSDADLALEFETHRPEDDGYSDVYLPVVSELEDALPTDVDVVVDTERQRAELERELAGDSPSLETARDRVALAAERLRNDPR